MSKPEPDLSNAGQDGGGGGSEMKHAGSAPEMGGASPPPSQTGDKKGVEQMQIQEPGAGPGHGGGIRAFLFHPPPWFNMIIYALVGIIIIGSLIAIGLWLLPGGGGGDKHPLASNPVLPGDSGWISPQTKTDKILPEEKTYMDELLTTYPYMSKSCGLSNRNLSAAETTGQANQRILYVNQSEVVPGQFPWQLEIFVLTKDLKSIGKLPFCGATLLSDRWALTAAHCMPKDGKLDLIEPNVDYYVIGGFVLVDEMKRYAAKHSQVRRKITKIIPKDGWEGGTRDNPETTKADSEGDIALVSWDEPFQRFHTRDGLVLLSPICLPSKKLIETHGTSYAGRHTVAGLGDVGTDPAGKVKQDRVRLTGYDYPKTSADYEKCSKSIKQYTDKFIIFCRTFNSAEPSACLGDSGGPLFSTALDPGSLKRRHFMTGIVSFGIPRNHENGTAIENPRCEDSILEGYTRVLEFVDWANEKIKANGGGTANDIY